MDVAGYADVVLGEEGCWEVRNYNSRDCEERTIEEVVWRVLEGGSFSLRVLCCDRQWGHEERL